MDTITIDPALIAKCGLYCGACRRYLKGSCPGCTKNERATWCKVRTCNLENSWGSCAECTQVENPMDCGKFNNFMSRLMGFIFRSDRAACIRMLKEQGREAFTAHMAENRQMTIKR